MSGRFLTAKTFAVALPTLVFALAPQAFAQDATVTVYSHGSLWTSGVPGAKHGIFYGCLYDGTQRLACFHEGLFLKNDRFAVFHFAAGAHTFSASYSKHPAKNSQLDLQLEPGKNYYMRVLSESRGVIEIEVERGHLDQVTCEVAQQETVKAVALKPKSISNEVKPGQLAEQIIPGCS